MAIKQIRSEEGDRFFIFLVVAAALIVVFALLRLWSRLIVFRSKNESRLWWDDWFCFITVPFAVTTNALLAYTTTIGLGSPVSEVPYQQEVHLYKIMTALYIIYVMAILFPKLSMLCFYVRALGGSQWRYFNLIIWIVGISATMCIIAAAMVQTFSCQPIPKLWDYMLPGHCNDFTTGWIITSAVQILLDAIVVIIPIPKLWTLRLPLGKKIALVGLFIIGYSAIAATIGRTVVVIQRHEYVLSDLTKNLIPIFFWDVLWPLLAMMGICIPSIFSLARRGWTGGFRALFRPAENSEFDSSYDQSRTSSVPSEKYDEKQRPRHVLSFYNDAESDISPPGSSSSKKRGRVEYAPSLNQYSPRFSTKIRPDVESSWLATEPVDDSYIWGLNLRHDLSRADKNEDDLDRCLGSTIRLSYMEQPEAFIYQSHG